MHTRNATTGDKLVLVELEGRRLLIPQTGEEVEIKVGQGVVTEIDYLAKEWKWYIIPRYFRMIEDAIFFYPENEDSPQIWLTGDRDRTSLNKLPLGAKFTVTKYRRVFKSTEDILLGKIWELADEAPGWEPLLENSQRLQSAYLH